jgi:hypothetical protein
MGRNTGINKDMERDILKAAAGRFVRFGTYGEPSLLPIELTRTICAVAKNWTGYTHQYKQRAEFAPYFMASTHSEAEEQSARLTIGARLLPLKGILKALFHVRQVRNKTTKVTVVNAAYVAGRKAREINLL